MKSVRHSNYQPVRFTQDSHVLGFRPLLANVALLASRRMRTGRHEFGRSWGIRHVSGRNDIILD